MLVRYEDLVASPKNKTIGLFSFLNEEYSDAILELALQKPRSAGFGDWKTHARAGIDNISVQRWRPLPPNTDSRLAEICNPVLETLGYSTETVREVDNQTVARRKYDFSAILGSKYD